MVPKDLQRLVWAFYVPGQEVRKNPSAGYMVVQGIAVAHVAWMEDKWSAQYRDDFVKAKLLRWGPHVTRAQFATIAAYARS